MNNILKKTISGVIALGMAVTSVQVSVPHVHTGHAEETETLVATGIKGDANADGFVTEADLDVYESYLLGNTEIAEDILEDMDIDYGNTYQFVEVNGNDYAAVRNYLEGCTQTIEPSGHIQYRTDGGIHTAMLYAGYYSSSAVYIAETDDLTNSTTEHEITEIIWDGGKPDWVTEVEREDGLYIDGTPDESDVGTYNMLIVGKSLSGKYHAIANGIEVCLPDYKVTTEDGNILYEGGACILFGPGTYNITSTATDVSDMIMIADIGQSGKYIINLNGMNINCGDTDIPGDFIQAVSIDSVMPTMDIDIVLSGSNVIRNADVDLYTEGQVNIYGGDDDTLSLLGNSSIRARAIKVNGGTITVKSNCYQAMEAEQLTMMGGSLDLSFSPVEGQQWNTSNTSLTGVGLACDEVIIRRGNLLLSGNDGAVQGIYSTPKLYVSPLYCDIDIDVSDDGTTYTAIEGSPFSDPDNSPSAYTDAVGAGIPDNSVDISDHVADKDFLKIVMGHTYSYKVTIDAGEHGNVTYEDDTAGQKSFWVAGGEKLPEGITLTADEGWEIDKMTASVNSALPVNVTDISEIVISGDTVISVTTKDIKAPIINGITDGSNYCGTITFTVTDDSDVSVTINSEVAQPDANGVYTIVGDTSAYGIKATDAFGNETLYTITVYETHPSLSNHQDNGDGTHTGICDFCNEDVTEDHNFGDWCPTDETTHEQICDDCGYIKTDGHIMDDWNPVDGSSHSRECSICHRLENASHDFDRWTDNQNKGVHERICLDCSYTDEAEHNYGEWTEEENTGKHKRECTDCGHTEDAEHVFGEWTDNHESGKCERECDTCGYTEKAGHVYGSWSYNNESGKCERECVNCGHVEEANHVFGEWTDNHQSGKCERECETCGYVEKADHIFGEWTDNHQSGKCERECETCGHVDEAEHDFGDWEAIPESGQHKRECENCGHTETGDHNIDDWTPHVQSNTHRAYCLDCGLLIAEPHSMGECEEYDDLLHITRCEDCAFFLIGDHTYSEWRDNAETGKHERECEGCGRTEEAEHNMDEYSEYDTSTHIRFCTDCGSYYEMEAHIYGAWEEIANTNNHKHECLICGYTEYRSHNYGDWTDNTETGKCERECEDCGRVQENEHNFDEWANDPDTGKHERICRNCGRTEEAEHNYSGWENDNESGKHIRMCLDCFHIEEAEHRLIQRDPSSLTQHMALCEDCNYYEFEDHSFDEWTYNNAYTHKHTCTLCGHEATEDHDYTNWTHDPETNEHRGECEICGHIEESEHVFGEWEHNPESGKCERKCNTCGYTEEAEHVFGEWTDNRYTCMHEKECMNCGYIEEEDHVYGEWIANPETDQHDRICEACGHTQADVHTFGDAVDNEETGKCEMTCTVCGLLVADEHLYSPFFDNHESGNHEAECLWCGRTIVSDHVYGEWESTGEADEHKRNCIHCGHRDAAEHTFGKWTETDNNTHEQKCEDCGYVKSEEHKFDNAVNIGNGQHKLTCSTCGAEMTEDCHGIWETVKEATCTEEGTEEMICEVCGEKHTKAIEKLPHDFVEGRCSSCFMIDPTLGDTSDNPPTGVPFASGLTALIPASMIVFFARPKSKKK